MQKEFRYTGIAQNGKAIQGVVIASNKSRAKQLIRDIEEKQNFTVNKIE